MLTHKTLALEVEASEMVESVKAKIQDKDTDGFNWESNPGCCIIFAGKRLEEGHTLADYNVTNDSVLFMASRFRM